MRCDNCKHWQKAKEYETGHGLGFGQCLNVPMFWDSTKWSGDGLARELKPEFADRKAFAQDGSDYSAELITAPDFGCISYCPAES